MENTDTKCGVEVRCYDYCTRPCVRVKGHSGGHNPFSDNVYDIPVNESKPVQINIEKHEDVTITYTSVINCLWSDAYGMCIYPLGHKGIHKSLGDLGKP